MKMLLFGKNRSNSSTQRKDEAYGVASKSKRVQNGQAQWKTGHHEAEPHFGGEQDTIHDDSIYTSMPAKRLGQAAADSERPFYSGARSCASSAIMSSATTVQIASGNAKPRKVTKSNNARYGQELKNHPRQSTKPRKDQGRGHQWGKDSKTRFSHHHDTDQLSVGSCSTTSSAPIPINFLPEEPQPNRSLALEKSLEKLGKSMPAAKLEKQMKEIKAGRRVGNHVRNGNMTPTPRDSQKKPFHLKEGSLASKACKSCPVDLDEEQDDDEDIDDDESSLFSFPLSRNGSGSNFEIDVCNPCNPTPAMTEIPRGNLHRGESTGSSASSFDIASYINTNENIDRCPSPGTIRLTQEGLSRHERSSLQESLRDPPKDPYEEWRYEKDTQEWDRRQHGEKERALFDETIRTNEALRKTTHQQKDIVNLPSPNNPEQYTRRRPRFGPFRKEKEDTAEISLAPLQEVVEEKGPISQPTGLGKMFRRKNHRSTEMAKSHLDKERQRAREAKLQHQLLVQQEEARIAQKKAEYLLKQREREGIGKPSASSPVSDKTARETCSNSSSTGAGLPPCVLCGQNPRTHIASPCMHFSFCSTCAQQLVNKTTVSCPVCCEPNVTFAAVSV